MLIVGSGNDLVNLSAQVDIIRGKGGTSGVEIKVIA
jgi:hypothetical protein